ncbi:unnamed protein product [Mytilus edulis]|uniref:Uncharacterized protein n=1 Tax=Mytilus edulis TaxID=6550 RepID=A0A8S3SLM2_MYTED|nr:unnamed protein product [Mytilus edulis]
MTEQISVVLTFDKSLKYMKFIIEKFCPEPENKASTSQNQNDAFQMMTAERSSFTKAPKLKDQNGPRFTDMNSKGKDAKGKQRRGKSSKLPTPRYQGRQVPWLSRLPTLYCSPFSLGQNLGGEMAADDYIDSLLDKIRTITGAYSPSESRNSAIPVLVGGLYRSGFWRDAASQQFSFESHEGTNKVGQSTLNYTLVKIPGQVRYSGVGISVRRNQYCNDIGHISSNDFIGCSQQPENSCMPIQRKIAAIESVSSGPQDESHCVFRTLTKYKRNSEEHVLAVQIILQRMPPGIVSWLTEKETVVQWVASKKALEPAAVVATAPSNCRGKKGVAQQQGEVNDAATAVEAESLSRETKRLKRERQRARKLAKRLLAEGGAEVVQTSDVSLRAKTAKKGPKVANVTPKADSAVV